MPREVFDDEPVMHQAVELAREIWDTCDWGPGDRGYCCLRHEERADRLLQLIRAAR
jgi:hypothetical protein